MRESRSVVPLWRQLARQSYTATFDANFGRMFLTITEFVKKYKGGTRSQARIPAEFIGYYIPQEKDIIIEDYVVLMFFDIDISEQTNFIEDLERFKREKEGRDKERRRRGNLHHY